MRPFDDRDDETLPTVTSLGDLLDLRASGRLTDDEYETLAAFFDPPRLDWRVCPVCGAQRALALPLEPDVMHCVACGVYLEYLGGGRWAPFAASVLAALTHPSSTPPHER